MLKWALNALRKFFVRCNDIWQGWQVQSIAFWCQRRMSSSWTTLIDCGKNIWIMEKRRDQSQIWRSWWLNIGADHGWQVYGLLLLRIWHEAFALHGLLKLWRNALESVKPTLCSLHLTLSCFICSFEHWRGQRVGKFYDAERRPSFWSAWLPICIDTMKHRKFFAFRKVFRCPWWRFSRSDGVVGKGHWLPW